LRPRNLSELTTDSILPYHGRPSELFRFCSPSCTFLGALSSRSDSSSNPNSLDGWPVMAQGQLRTWPRNYKPCNQETKSPDRAKLYSDFTHHPQSCNPTNSLNDVGIPNGTPFPQAPIRRNVGSRFHFNQITDTLSLHHQANCRYLDDSYHRRRHVT
jgi:hypothetical protein